MTNIAALTDLQTLKSKPLTTRIAVIDALTGALKSGATAFRGLLATDTVIDLSSEDDERLVRYVTISIYASDIASIPDRASRAKYLDDLREVTDAYNMDYNRVIYLTQFETKLAGEVERQLSGNQQ